MGKEGWPVEMLLRSFQSLENREWGRGEGDMTHALERSILLSDRGRN